VISVAVTFCAPLKFFFCEQVYKHVRSMWSAADITIIQRLYWEILNENRRARLKEKKSFREEVIPRFAWLYSHVCRWCKEIKIGGTFDEMRADGKHSSTSMPRVLAWKIRIDLGTCDFDTAERRLLRAETLVRIIVQPHLMVQSGEVL
jgi:hypothetical protein